MHDLFARQFDFLQNMSTTEFAKQFFDNSLTDKTLQFLKEILEQGLRIVPLLVQLQEVFVRTDPQLFKYKEAFPNSFRDVPFDAYPVQLCKDPYSFQHHFALIQRNHF